MAKVAVQMGADGTSWDVVKGGELVATGLTIKAAMTLKGELLAKPAPQVLYFRQDGSEATKRPSTRRA